MFCTQREFLIGIERFDYVDKIAVSSEITQNTLIHSGQSVDFWNLNLAVQIVTIRLDVVNNKASCMFLLYCCSSEDALVILVTVSS